MVPILPSPREGPFSSSHSWTSTEMNLQPAPGGAPKHWLGERGAGYVPLVFYFSFKEFVGSKWDHTQPFSTLGAPQNLGDSLGRLQQAQGMAGKVSPQGQGLLSRQIWSRSPSMNIPAILLPLREPQVPSPSSSQPQPHCKRQPGGSASTESPSPQGCRAPHQQDEDRPQILSKVTSSQPLQIQHSPNTLLCPVTSHLTLCMAQKTHFYPYHRITDGLG